MTVTGDLINLAKMARRITTDAYNSQIEMILNAGLQDLGVAGVVVPDESTAIVEQALITYFLMNFGEPDNYDRLKASYDEQKAQLSMHTGFTDWSVING